MRIFELKKKKTCALLAAMLSVVVVAFALTSPMIVYATRMASKKPTIVIDAGHGGADAGVTGKTTGLRESDLNLQIAMILGEMLKGAGYFVVYTRTNDTMLDIVKADTKKRSDMFSRAKIINNVGADIVVSIHANYFPSEARRGAQVFFERKSEGAFQLATCVQNSLNVINEEKTDRLYSPLTADKYLLTCSPAVSIIVECGFLSNPADEILLQTPEYRAQIAEAIVQGLCKYFEIAL
ncbi:MAG: N-acetylmuramoyl-L-alanine amidase [Elusimicrobiaceae bacterium]|nr:N-acetylmuramoyl-L-alanine amidase [Elusimicrobiaceae bacterium]